MLEGVREAAVDTEYQQLLRKGSMRTETHSTTALLPSLVSTPPASPSPTSLPPLLRVLFLHSRLFSSSRSAVSEILRLQAQAGQQMSGRADERTATHGSMFSRWLAAENRTASLSICRERPLMEGRAMRWKVRTLTSSCSSLVETDASFFDPGLPPELSSSLSPVCRARFLAWPVLLTGTASLAPVDE